MRLRCLVLLGIGCGLASADSTQDYFARAFGRTFPSPFASPLPNRDSRLFHPGFEAGELKGMPRVAVVVTPDCAIPLREAPVPADKLFSIRNSPAQSQKTDPMAVLPAARVCER